MLETGMFGRFVRKFRGAFQWTRDDDFVQVCKIVIIAIVLLFMKLTTQDRG